MVLTSAEHDMRTGRRRSVALVATMGPSGSGPAGPVPVQLGIGNAVAVVRGFGRTNRCSRDALPQGLS